MSPPTGFRIWWGNFRGGSSPPFAPFDSNYLEQLYQLYPGLYPVGVSHMFSPQTLHFCLHPESQWVPLSLTGNNSIAVTVQFLSPFSVPVLFVNTDFTMRFRRNLGIHCSRSYGLFIAVVSLADTIWLLYRTR